MKKDPSTSEIVVFELYHMLFCTTAAIYYRLEDICVPFHLTHIGFKSRFYNKIKYNL